MKRLRLLYYFAIFGLGLLLGPGFAVQAAPASALVEPFDDASQFTATPFFSDGGFDYFGLTGGDFGGDAAPSGLKAYTGFTGSYLAGMDLDGEGASLPIVVDWTGIDIDGLSALEFSGDFAEFFDDPGDIDATDYIDVSYQIDGGGYVDLLSFRLDENEPDVFNGVFREDTDFNGSGDGVTLGDAAQTFVKAIPGTGATLDLRLSVSVDSGDEDFAVDNFAINGESTPTGLVEPFDDASQFTATPFFSDGGFDYFGLTGGDFGGDAAPSGLKAYTGFTGSYLAGMDLDGEGASLPIVVDWTGINIDGLSAVEFSGDFAEFFDDPGDIDAADYIDVLYQIDGGGYVNLLSFRLDQSEPDEFNGVFREDTDFNGRGDGATLGNAAQTFVKAIPGTGATLDLRLSVSVDSGDEDFAVDNFVVRSASAPPVCDNIAIADVQGSGDVTPFAGQTVTIRGLVTAVFGGELMVQEDTSAPRSGMAVFSSGHTASVGDEVCVTGVASERFDQTQVGGNSNPDATVDILSSDNTLPDPAVLTTGELAAAATAEQWEAVLVRVENVTVDNPDLGFGEFSVDDGSGALRVDDKGFLYAATAGESLDFVQGPLNFSFSNYKIEPRDEMDIGVPAPPPTVFINEIHYDNDGSDVGEGVEVAGTAGTDLSGWQLVLYNGNGGGVYATETLSGTLPDQDNGYGTLAFFISGIQNGSPDGVALVDADGNVVQFLTYEGTITATDGPANGMTSIDIGVAEGSSTPVGSSLQLVGSGTTYAEFSWATPQPNTFGAVNTNQDFGSGGGGGPEMAMIHEVQGSGTDIAINGLVTVNAVVVGDYQGGDQLNGFFIQEEDVDADADPATSEGIFVYCGGCAVDVTVGDQVEVTGLAEDFFGMSQIDVAGSGSSVVVVSGGNALPTPAIVDLPAGGSTEAAATFENVEGMLVSFADTLYVSEYFELARYGQLVLTADARPRQFTDEFEPDVAGYAAFLADLESKRIILDDENNTQNAPLASNPADDTPYFWPTPGLSDANYVRGGDSISGLTGVMHWSFAGQSGTDAWRIRPVTEAFTYTFTEENPRTDMPDDVGGSFTVASFNVLNYFTTLDSRGADSQVELDRQREKIAAAICAMDADVVGLIEIENNGSVALNDLLNGANGINANCGPYDYVDTGVIGTDQIAVAFIYKTATAAPVGDFAVLDSSVDSRFVDTKNRPALAQTFEETATGGMLTVVVNHLKSKGSDCDDLGDPDLGDGQANCNLTRANAAAAMVDWLATDPTGSGDSDFLIIGDLNAYRNEDPIDNLELGADDTAGTADDYTDLLNAFLGDAAYSYLFDGQTGYLDYALANGDLLTQVTGVTAWHINADEIPVFDYNDGVQDAGEPSFQRESTALDIYEPDAFRASDHDPVLVGLNLFVPNTPPVVEAITLPEPADVGEMVTVSALFSDVDGTSDEPFTCTVDFGDGMGPQTGMVNGFTCTASTMYSEDGFYTVTVTVADSHGESDTVSAEYLVIFDSSPRGAIGRGRLAVSAGDYQLDPSITGRSVFFFKAQYRSTGLEGRLNMSVYEQGTRIFEMRSTALDWLVLDGPFVILEGSGQIDGSGDYGFRVTAVNARESGGDFAEDLIRIVIWDKATGDVVFDNQSTCADQGMLAIPCSTIKGGAIRTYIVD